MNNQFTRIHTHDCEATDDVQCRRPECAAYTPQKPPVTQPDEPVTIAARDEETYTVFEQDGSVRAKLVPQSQLPPESDNFGYVVATSELSDHT
jgi:hypothetical protein